MAHDLLVIEDERSIVRGLLAADGTLSCRGAQWEGLLPERLLACGADLIVADVAGDTPQALGLFEWLRTHTLPTPTIAILPVDPPDTLMRSVAEVADDFILSPLRRGELRQRVSRLLGPPVESATAIRRRLSEELGRAELIGNDAAFVEVVEELSVIASSGASVLITGETGTGKEVCARAIHHLSERRAFPFIAVDCAAIPDHLFENELFGHVRGAFTDAHQDHKGLVRMADGGTLLLDEVDALSIAAQAKLLRFLQEHSYRPLGADRFCQADVTVIAATNRDLEAAVRERAFRADLYFRLNVIQLHLPPLRQRRGDVALLARHFAESLRRPPGQPVKTITPAAIAWLTQYDWPGNVRQLLNVIQRALVRADGPLVLPHHLLLPGGDSGDSREHTFRHARSAAIAAFERAYVAELLRKHGGNVSRAAVEAKKDRRVFGRLVKKYNIDKRSF